MPKNTARIGKREEREIVKDLERRGYTCRRQPGSGNRAVDLQHDVVWQSPIGTLHIEDKYREKSQWQRLEGYRAGADILTLRCDARHAGQDGKRMVFMSWELFLGLIGDAGERVPGMEDGPQDRQVWERGLGKPKIPQRANQWPPKGSRKIQGSVPLTATNNDPWPKGRKIPSRRAT